MLGAYHPIIAQFIGNVELFMRAYIGLVIWRQWPISSLWAVGMLVGIGMIMTGATRLMMALAVRKAQPA